MAEGEWGVGRLAEPDEIVARASAAARARAAHRQARARHRRRHARADRRGPLRRQPLLRTHGRRARRGGAPARRRGRSCSPPTWPFPRAARRRGDPDPDRRVDARRRARARRTSTSLLLAAAVADYRAGRAARSEAREGRRATWTLELAPTQDIARALGERKRTGQVLVAFGAEHGEEGLERKRAMLETKNADLVVFNDVGSADIGFDGHENEVVLSRARRAHRAEGAEGSGRGRDPRRRPGPAPATAMSDAYEFFREGRSGCAAA